MHDTTKGHWPHLPAQYDEHVIMAVRAFSEGKANDGQQKLVWLWLTQQVCQLDGMSFYLGGEDGRRSSDFAEGRRYVGNTLRKMLNPITLAAWREKHGKSEAEASK